MAVERKTKRVIVVAGVIRPASKSNNFGVIRNGKFVSLMKQDATEQGNMPAPVKPFSAMDFAGVAPTGRTAEEIDAEIAEGRGDKLGVG